MTTRRRSFGYDGDRATCRWCGRPLRIERATRDATENEAAEINAWVELNGKQGKRRIVHPELGPAFLFGGLSNYPPSLLNGQIKVGVEGRYRAADEAPAGEHEADSVFCTYVCGVQFAERMVDLGHILKLQKQKDARREIPTEPNP